MTDRIEVIVLGRKLGTASGWDGDPSETIWFYDFQPKEGIKLTYCDLAIDFVQGYFGPMAPEGEMEDGKDIISFLSEVSR